MEEDQQVLGDDANSGWQLRWGHILIALVVVAAGYGGWALSHKSTPTKTANCSQSISNAPCPPKGGSNKKHQATTAKPSAPTPTSGTSTPTNTSSQTPNSSSTGTQPAAASTQALVNTGPGDVIGLFAGTVLTGAALYALRLRRRWSL
ncbi:MAG TPA: hypothetical protein VGS08_00510 [Candidatus Saccharimonadales bacterium]|nr:hypothetical protein [Candidatus Saccharimonadales bacterium]